MSTTSWLIVAALAAAAWWMWGKARTKQPECRTCGQRGEPLNGDGMCGSCDLLLCTDTGPGRQLEWIPCPCGNDSACEWCGGDGDVPAWVADPRLAGAATAAAWRRHEKASKGAAA